MSKRFYLLVLFISLFCAGQVMAQAPDSIKAAPNSYYKLSYTNPRQYIIAGIEIKGTEYYDKSVLTVLSGLQIGQKIRIPSEDISKAITNLWKQKLFEDVKLSISKIEEDKVWLEIYLKEKPRLSSFTIKGLKKSKAEELRESITLKTGQIITENVLNSTSREIRKYFEEKGYLDVKTTFEQIPDDLKRNTVRLKIAVDRGKKVIISDVTFRGNDHLESAKIKKVMKDTKPKYFFFTKSKYIEDKYLEDKQKVLDKYLSMGYRDVQIVSDSIWRDQKGIRINMDIFEGRKYYFRNINFIGNTKYKSEDLHKVLRIKSGDVYDQSILDQRLSASQDGNDINTIYMDDGYLFFRCEPIEVLIEHDSIDLEIRISEGSQAYINSVTVKGNSKTSDHVVLRELRTKPGMLFSKSDITRSLRELSQIGYFNPEALNVNPVPNPNTGTVDIEYKVEERPNDQIELSGGWGAGFVVGTLGLSLNNFSMRKAVEAKNWSPIPSGDGQRLSLRAQTNGSYYQSYSASFTEPWLGGKRPNALTVSVYHSIQSNGKQGELRSGLYTTGAMIGLGKRLRWPDDFFTLQYQLGYQLYNNDPDLAGNVYWSNIPSGKSNNLSLKFILGRNSTDQPIYPRMGSNISLSLQFTPPYSMFDKVDYKNVEASQKTKWLEFYKWKFDATWYSKLAGNKRPLVLMTRINFGYIGAYNQDKGVTPFERFWVGGSGLTGFSLDGRELVALRGYQDNSLTPYVISPTTGTYTQTGATIYNRYTMELRYPISLNPQATVFPLVFAEAGGTWLDPKKFNPFEVNRSYGMGVRIFLPMFGMIGLDYGWGIDLPPNHPNPARVNGGNFHFLLGQQF
ncbi:MAG: outer membrane protein assembly factor BamA [Bacteroidetes bacterium B1(2017)]|nr:MAG: outer membrane protein assembly factor BamA [Bacteroidetes bacterium B1(2017)]